MKVIRKVLLDHVTLISATNHEVPEPMETIELHDMPKDRLPSNFDHWFRA